MSSKKPNLAARLASAAGPQPVHLAALAAEAVPEQDTAPRTPLTAVSGPPAAIAKARQGKTMIAGYFSPELAKAVKMLSVEQNTTVQALIGEALDDLLRRHGKHPFNER